MGPSSFLLQSVETGKYGCNKIIGLRGHRAYTPRVPGCSGSHCPSRVRSEEARGLFLGGELDEEWARGERVTVCGFLNENVYANVH